MRAGTTNEKGRCARIFHLIVRILTLPPIVIGITVLLMYVPAKLMTLRELLLCELFLLLIPMAAYPIREIFHIGKDRRKGQRSTALVCSAIGYLCGFLWSILTPCSWLVHILFLFETVTPHPAAAPDWLGSQSACLWYFIADLRTRLIVMQPNNQKMRCTTIAQCGMAHFLCNYSQSYFFGSPNRRIIWILHQPDLIRVGSKHDDGI